MELKGGMHVLQTFLSEEEAEEIQIRGRSARQDKSGTYKLILYSDDLAKFFNDDEQIIFSKHRFKKFIKDVVNGTIERDDIINEEIKSNLHADIDIKNIEKVYPDFISTGNIGCITQISTGTRIPIIHTVELLDWFTGGPKPNKLQSL